MRIAFDPFLLPLNVSNVPEEDENERSPTIDPSVP